MNPEGTVVSEMSQVQNNSYYMILHICEFKESQLIEVEKLLEVEEMIGGQSFSEATLVRF